MKYILNSIIFIALAVSIWSLLETQHIHNVRNATPICEDYGLVSGTRHLNIQKDQRRKHMSIVPPQKYIKIDCDDPL